MGYVFVANISALAASVGQGFARFARLTVGKVAAQVGALAFWL